MNNNNNNLISLPFFETIRRSFLYVFSNIRTVFNFSVIFYSLIVLEIFMSYPTICDMYSKTCNENMQSLSFLLVSLTTVAIVIRFCNLIVSKQDETYWSKSFGKKTLKYIAYSLAIILSVMLASYILVYITSLLIATLSVGSQLINLVALIPLVLIIICARFSLVFPAIAVGNNEIGLKKSFLMTKGNANKIFWGQLVLMLPVVLLFLLFSSISKVIGFDGFVIKILMTVLVLSLSFFDAALKASFYAHVYQYFMFFDKKEELKAE